MHKRVVLASAPQHPEDLAALGRPPVSLAGVAAGEANELDWEVGSLPVERARSRERFPIPGPFWNALTAEPAVPGRRTSLHRGASGAVAMAARNVA